MTKRSLAHELTVIVAIKLAILTAIWWFFIRDFRVEVVVPPEGSAMKARPLVETSKHQPSQPHGGPNGD
ncbi:MAG: hypothetical protein KDH16_03280 [Rhodocyclaceae bacterium]|nr:hypothetical protein [Rhodocyclaceae bacterium]